jgi:hypothetical protein
MTKTKALTPQAIQVLDHMTVAGSITGVEAAAVLKVRHLPRRILDLKESGISIRKEMKQDSQGQRYARYWLEQAA